MLHNNILYVSNRSYWIDWVFYLKSVKLLKKKFKKISTLKFLVENNFWNLKIIEKKKRLFFFFIITCSRRLIFCLPISALSLLPPLRASTVCTYILSYILYIKLLLTPHTNRSVMNVEVSTFVKVQVKIVSPPPFFFFTEFDTAVASFPSTAQRSRQS